MLTKICVFNKKIYKKPGKQHKLVSQQTVTRPTRWLNNAPTKAGLQRQLQKQTSSFAGFLHNSLFLFALLLIPCAQLSLLFPLPSTTRFKFTCLTFRMLTNNFVLQRMRALCPPVRHVNCEKFACYETSKLTKWNIFHLFSEKNVAKLVVMVRLLITYTLCACCGPAKAIATAATSAINIVGIACIYVLALLRFHLFC